MPSTILRPTIRPMVATPVILDVDTGVDDACALLLAARHPALDLRAVTCVGGNAPLPDVVRNTLTVLATAGRPTVPVAAGAGSREAAAFDAIARRLIDAGLV